MAPPGNKKNFKKGGNNNGSLERKPVTQDPRFTSVHNDPRFVRPKKRDTKVTIDSRFASMMNSTEFSDAPRIDKYGRRLDQDTAEKNLKRFYQLDDNEQQDSESDSDNDRFPDKSLEELERELAADPDNLADEIDAKTGYDPMRGRGEISSSDDSSDDEEEAEAIEEVELDEIDKIKHIQEGEETSRLAAVNMDWDKIKAVDILKALSGFKPDTGVIRSVTIYPSEFGKERMELEEAQGPPSEIFKTGSIIATDKNTNKEDGSDDEEEITAETLIKSQLEEGDGMDFDQEALRKYQLDRLKYYYAVIQCDSPQTAKTIYKSVDNTEYESSANFFDLRYIPEDMTFEEDAVKDKATLAPEGYQPTKFKTNALQRTKVSLTWDEDDVSRYEVTRREFTQEDLKTLDFDAYLASSDEDEDEEAGENVEAMREKYRKLLAGSGSKGSSAFDDAVGEDADEEGDMEITFTPGLSEAAAAAAKEEKEGANKEETTIETYVRKQKEKRQAKKKASVSKVQKEDDNDSDMDKETEDDPFFKEAMEEMEQEGFVANSDKKKEKKNNKKRASKEEREEKARSRAELELLMDDDAGKSEGFNMKEVLKREKLEKKKKGGKKNKKLAAELGEDDFEINVTDPRFAAVQESHHFAIDPTSPHFKKTKSMKQLMDARQSKLKEGKGAADDEWKKSTKSSSNSGKKNEGETKSNKSSLDQLVASVKRKGALDKNTAGKRQKKN